MEIETVVWILFGFAVLFGASIGVVLLMAILKEKKKKDSGQE